MIETIPKLGDAELRDGMQEAGERSPEFNDKARSASVVIIDKIDDIDRSASMDSLVEAKKGLARGWERYRRHIK